MTTRDGAIKWINLLHDMGFDATGRTEQEWLEFPGLGKKMLNEIKMILKGDADISCGLYCCGKPYAERRSKSYCPCQAMKLSKGEI